MSDPFDLADPTPPGAARPPVSTAYLNGLNESQRAAVEAVDGPVLVLAGAGTGKTRVLISRLAHILTLGRANPWGILAVTFTNRAANEMKERVGVALDRPVEGWWVGTFHALAARMLRAHAETVGLKSNFTILDTDDQIRVVKQLAETHRLDEKKWPARVISGKLQRWKDRGLLPDKVSLAEGGDEADGKILTLYRDYQQRLRELNACDFGDLLLHCLTMFQGHPDILAKFQAQFRYLLVDEYQDTNVAQYLWLRLLAQKHKNICCVGDDDQSIYSWRGAEVGNILGFEKDFPGAKVVRLERNYRSTPHILAAASSLIAHNRDRLGKTLWTDLNEGEKVGVRGVWDGVEEARQVCDEIETLQRRKHPLRQLAVLVRAGFQTREFEERLITLGIPYRVVGGPRFYERMEIRDAVAYLRVVAQPDDDLAFERIVNVPKRGIGDATLQTLHKVARATRRSLTATLAEVLDTDELKPSAKNTLKGLMDDFARWRSKMGDLTAAEITQMVLEDSGYIDMWKHHKSIEAPGRVDNLKEMIGALEEFDTLGDFLDHVSLVMENDEAVGVDKVTLMTMHSAKGLEFDYVFLPGWEEGLFPHQRALDEGGLEEERRLAYVALTRARRRASVSFAASRRIYNSWQSAIPSRFIDELPEDHVSVTTDPGLYGGRTATPTDFAGGGAGARFQGKKAPAHETWAPVNDGTVHFEAGERVFHQKFGYGRILGVEGNKLRIAFDKAGDKMVLDNFVKSA
jgi:DNA helicase-2/ATP-dependent DNA helicase PcrA